MVEITGKDILERGPAEEIKDKLLKYLELFDKEGWEVIGWQNMNMKDIQWFSQPQKLLASTAYRIINLLLENQEIIPPKKENLQGAAIKSVHFFLWLKKNDNISIIAYGRHTPDNGSNVLLAQTGFSIIFRKANAIPKK